MGLIHQDSKECQHKVALAAIPVQTLILNDSRDLEGLNQLCQLLFSQDRPEYLVSSPAIHFLWLTTFLENLNFIEVAVSTLFIKPKVFDPAQI